MAYLKYPYAQDYASFIPGILFVVVLLLAFVLYMKAPFQYLLEDIYNEENSLCFCCRYGYIDAVKFIHSTNVINVHDRNEEAFLLACQHGHLAVAQWLYKLKPDLDISIEDEWAFCCACENGHLAVAQWLLEVKPDIDICCSIWTNRCTSIEYITDTWTDNHWSDLNNDTAFNKACQNGHIAVVKWLLQIKPDLDFWNTKKHCATARRI